MRPSTGCSTSSGSPLLPSPRLWVCLLSEDPLVSVCKPQIKRGTLKKDTPTWRGGARGIEGETKVGGSVRSVVQTCRESNCQGLKMLKFNSISYFGMFRSVLPDAKSWWIIGQDSLESSHEPGASKSSARRTRFTRSNGQLWMGNALVQTPGLEFG